MSTAGPNYPGSGASLANAGTSESANAWANPGNIGSGATVASITAATYDSPDISEILVASNFGFAITAGSTIDGITVEISKRGYTSANSGVDNRVQLATGTTFATLVGTNKASASVWPQNTLATTTYGGVADTWTAGLTAAQVNDAGFSVFLSAKANVANADIDVDWIRVTITYTPPSATNADAILATGAGTAAKPTATVQPVPGLATGSGTSQTPTAKVSVPAGLATATGAAYGTITTHPVDAAPATATATAQNTRHVTWHGWSLTYQNSTGSLNVDAGLATATASGQDAAGSISAQPGLAAATGTAINPTVSTLVATYVDAGLATAAGTAQVPAASLLVNASQATSSGSAINPTVSFVIATNVDAGLATAAASVVNSNTSVSPSGGLATGSGAAYDVTFPVSGAAFPPQVIFIM